MADVLAPVTRLWLGPGVFPLKNTTGQSRLFVMNEVEISPSKCPHQSLCEGSILQITNETMPFIIVGNLTIKHVTIKGGFSLVDNCEQQACTYCPAMTLDPEANWVNDNGEILTLFASKSECRKYENFTLFSVYVGAHLTLENVTFESITHQPNSLIRSKDGFLSILNVTFSQLIMLRNIADNAVITQRASRLDIHPRQCYPAFKQLVRIRP
jgi:hypothetical protein